MLYIIYRIRVETADGKILSYYGHTDDFERRKGEHVSNHRRWNTAGKPEKVSVVHGVTRSVLVLDHEGWDMEEVDTIECDKEEDAEKLEGEWIRSHDCVNRIIPRRTRKQRHLDNREKDNENSRQYHHDNREKLSEKHKQNYQKNREKRCEKQHQYYEQNRATINEKKKEKVTCDICGSLVRKDGIPDHHKSKKCLAVKLSQQNTNANDVIPSSP